MAAAAFESSCSNFDNKWPLLFATQQVASLHQAATHERSQAADMKANRLLANTRAGYFLSNVASPNSIPRRLLSGELLLLLLRDSNFSALDDAHRDRGSKSSEQRWTLVARRPASIVA